MHLFGTYGVRILLQWYCQIPGSRLWDQDRRDQVVNERMYDKFGFFRDQYLFRSGVRLSPRDIYEISDMVSQLQFLAGIRSPGRKMIEFTFPRAIHENYPRDVVLDEASGLPNLREVARPPVRVGLPERHFVGNR
jgi:anaerobic magnesium-protoporphyrin IX monomethyl ester cyclase